MAHVEDRWMKKGPGKNKVKTALYGSGVRWRAVWTEPGRPGRLREPFDTKEAALAKIAEVMVSQTAGTYVSAADGKITLDEYAKEWMESQLHQRTNSASKMTSDWKNHILPQLGRFALADLTRARVQAAVAVWKKTLAASTIEVVFSYLQSALIAAVKDRRIPANPCAEVNLPAIVGTKVIPLTPQQVHQMAENMPPRYRAMVWLGAATGMRQGEMRGLTVDRLRLGVDSVTIRIDQQLATTKPTWGPPKTARGDRTIQGDPELADALRRHIANFPPHQSGLLFTGRTRIPIGRPTMASIWNTARAGVIFKERSGWHELRHFHASMLIAKGLSVAAVADRLGDTSEEILKTYIHLWHTDEAKAMAAITDGFWATQPTAVRALRLVPDAIEVAE